jgi:hypothetical protein
MSKLQFRVLYREFLFRIVDLELLAPQGDPSKLLGQFAGLLIFVSWWLSAVAGMMAGSQKNPLQGLLLAWMAQHFLIATTMLAVGLFAVMSWESTFPDHRDVQVLSPLPIEARTVLLAKVAAVATALSVTVSALNVFTGIIGPLTVASGRGGVLRSFAAYWITMFAAGIFIFACVLSVQGLAQLLQRQKYLRVSSFVQTTFFIALMTVYFLQPPFSEVKDLIADQAALRWIPSYWFFGLFHQLNGTMLAPFAFLARRAWIGLGTAGCGAAGAYLVCYFRTLRKIAEQPDILPARSRLRWLPPFGNPMQTAVGQFSVRTLMRSRQHRVMLSFYAGIGLGLAMFISGAPELYHHTSGLGAWSRANVSLMMASALILCAAVLGTRVVFSLPLEFRANWIFRIMPRAGVSECLAATRRSLYGLSVAPVWIASAALFFWLWPWRTAAEHLAVLALLGTIVAELCLHGFQKIPFTCSYLPGKTHFNMALMYLVVFLLAVEWGASLEMGALSSPARFAAAIAIFMCAAGLARWRTAVQAKAEEAEVQFDESPEPAIFALDLHRDGVTPLP